MRSTPNVSFFTSHRGDNTIALFQIDQATGLLTAVDRTSTEGKTPRNFAIDPSGGWLFTANQDSGNVVIFRIDAQTGRLKAGKNVEIASPVCIVFAKP